MNKTLSKDELEAHLSASDRRKAFEVLGFRLNGHQPNDEGYVTGVLGPPQLGEGETGNFSVNIFTGAVKELWLQRLHWRPL